MQQHAWGVSCIRSCLIPRTATETYLKNALLEALSGAREGSRSAVQPPEAELSALLRLGFDRIIFFCDGSAHKPLACTLLRSWGSSEDVAEAPRDDQAYGGAPYSQYREHSHKVKRPKS